MKVLFVCVKNIARSQMAEAFYRKYSGSEEVQSAGYNPGGWLGKVLDEKRSTVLCMDEERINLRGKFSKKLDKTMEEWADKIIVFDSMKENWPQFLRDSKKVEIWEVPDPGGKGIENHLIALDMIKEKVKELVRKDKST